MADAEEFRALADLDEDTLEAWRSAGWLRPREGAGGLVYAEIDVARAQLIRDLRDDFGINDEGVTVVLDLVDQLHVLRRSLREILAGARSRTRGDQAPHPRRSRDGGRPRVGGWLARTGRGHGHPEAQGIAVGGGDGGGSALTV
jgi:chaperone modulatory protein CbpM